MKKRVTDVLGSYFFYFMLYSIIGWIYEVFLEVVVYKWGFTNRGVLYGPYCPVYGVGALAFLFTVRPILRRKWESKLRYLKPVFAFLGCMFVATAIELVTSYALEAITGSWPWQTYVDYAINFQGRIALSPSIRFGLGGVLFLYVLQPCFEFITRKMPEKVKNKLFPALFLIFVADIALTLIF